MGFGKMAVRFIEFSPTGKTSNLELQIILKPRIILMFTSQQNIFGAYFNGR